MARYTDAVCRLCRREAQKLYLKGDRCMSPKCAVERRGVPPGQHARKVQFKRNQSDYSLQLREKQKVKRIYGVMERQFRRYFRYAVRSKGLTGATLLVVLESAPILPLICEIAPRSCDCSRPVWEVAKPHIKISPRILITL